MIINKLSTKGIGKLKRIISLILLLVLMAGLSRSIAMADCTPTRDEAIQWLYNQEGVWYDLDNKYGAQCSDFASAYMNWLYSGNTNPNLGYGVYNASYYPTVASWNTSRWDVFANTAGFSPEPGDIFVQSAHIGVFLSGSKSSAKVIDQNSWETWALAEQYGGTGRAARIYTTNLSNATHFIRYKYFRVLPSTYTIDVNGILDGNNAGDISGYGTFDIYINGILAGNDVSDYYNSALSAGTSYSITDIRPTTGHIYSGAVGNLSGTIPAGSTVTVKLKFDTCTDHSYGTGVITKEATCTEAGMKTFTCTKCGSAKTETISILAHKPVIDPAVPATVTTTGLTEGSHCGVCGTVIIAQQVVPKLPRVPYDFDMDGVAEPVMALPSALNTIEVSAFEGGTARVVIIPDGTTTIGSRAFADMPSLVAIFIPESVKTISFDVFDGSPNVKLYVSKGSKWGTRLDLPAVEIENGWVLADNVPLGAEITDRKWTYTSREYTDSSSASYPGWTKYDTKISWTDWSEWQNSEISASSDREVRTQTIVTGYNMISYCVSGPQGRSYQPSPTYTVRLQHGPYWWSKAELDSARVFYAGSYFNYESNVAGYVLDGTAYCKWDGSDTGGYIPMFIQETTYGTQWSYRDAVYTYSYYRDIDEESAADPSGQDNVSNIQEWVKYSY